MKATVIVVGFSAFGAAEASAAGRPPPEEQAVSVRRQVARAAVAERVWRRVMGVDLSGVEPGEGAGGVRGCDGGAI